MWPNDLGTSLWHLVKQVWLLSYTHIILESKARQGQRLPAKQFVRVIACGAGPLLSAKLLFLNKIIIIMKSIKQHINEAKKTDFEKIENIGESWIKEWWIAFSGNILAAIMKGIKRGVEESKKSIDEKEEKRIKDCINDIIKK